MKLFNDAWSELNNLQTNGKENNKRWERQKPYAEYVVKAA
jgi:hypothetical protein